MERNTFGSQLIKNQVKKYSKEYSDGVGNIFRMDVGIRWDDDCGNGRNTFAITADIFERRERVGINKVAYKWAGGGSCHEEIAKRFPELAKYIKWHLCGSDGPMHYIANVLYLAGDRDCSGKKKGEVSGYKEKVYIKGLPQGLPMNISVKEYKHYLEHGDAEVIEVKHDGGSRDAYKFDPKYTLFASKWHECGFDTREEANACIELFRAGRCEIMLTPTGYSDGKERELDSARSVAVWPEATDDDLSREPHELKRALEERLPALMSEFRKDIEELGFTW